MGWSYACDRHYDKQCLIEDLTKPGVLSPGYTFLEHRVVGNHLWYLYQQPDGIKTIGLFLMASGGREMGWGHKGISESMGPYETDCPLSLLNMAGDVAPNESAAQWRERVRQHHAVTKTVSKSWATLSHGRLIELDGVQYEVLTGPQNGRTKALIKRLSDGKNFSLTRKVFKSCKLIAPERQASAEPPATTDSAKASNARQEDLFGMAA
jgi:hypothetical protein